MEDELYVYGACCTWHGPISETKPTGGTVLANGGRIGVSIPGCPHCGGVLMQYKDRAEWDDNVAKFMKHHRDLPLYREWLETLHGPCRPVKDWDWRATYAEFVAKRTV